MSENIPQFVCVTHLYDPQLETLVDFFQLGNSGNSAISVNGKGLLTNAKQYVKRKVFFQKVKLNYRDYQVTGVSSTARLTLKF